MKESEHKRDLVPRVRGISKPLTLILATRFPYTRDVFTRTNGTSREYLSEKIVLLK